MKPTHESYETEASESSGVKVTCLADIKPLDEATRAALESSYRRGYYQGAAKAIDAVERGSPKIHDWLQELFDWRYLRNHRGNMEPPPEINKCHKPFPDPRSESPQ